MGRRALLLLNPGARKASLEDSEWRTVLTSGGIDLAEPEPDDEQLDWIESQQKNAQLVIVGGGDGTLNSVIDAVARSGLPLGIIPLGTANDLARTLEIPPDPAAACEVIVAGATRTIDLGEVNGKLFFNVASIGLSVAITRAMDAKSKRFWGVFAYLKSALRILWQSRPFHAEVLANGETHRVRTVQISVGNGRHYGGGMTVDQDATIDDSQLDLFSIEVNHWWQILLLAPRLRSGSLWKSRHVRTLRGTAFEIRTRRPRSINTDGEITRETPATFRVLPRALNVFAPPEPQANVPG